MKKRTFIILALIIVVLGAIFYTLKPINRFIPSNTEVKVTDAQKFKAEYAGVSEDNKFVYKSPEEIINILKTGTGLVYLGFPECPWCQKYTIYLDEVVKETGLEKVYYLNIRQIRASSTPEYMEMVSLIGEKLDKDADGNPRIFVPDVTAVKDGVILSHDNTTSLNTSADGTPDEWWTKERVEALKTKLREMIKPVNVCEETCNA